jgi:hypothetical protein
VAADAVDLRREQHHEDRRKQVSFQALRRL